MIGLRRIPDRWRQFDVTVRDLPFALLIAVASLVPAVESHGTQLGDVPNRPLDATAVLVVLLECLPLALRRRWPLLGLALVSIGFAGDELRGYHTLATIALPIALLNAGLHAGRLRRVAMAAASGAYVVLALVLAEGLAGLLTLYLGLATAWGAGAWLRLSRTAEAEHRRHVAETTRAAERTRIAQDLHDVVTHHVTAMVVQAEAARYLTAAPDRLDQTLTAITDTGRRAVTDLRHLLDLLNPDHGIVPRTVGDLHELVEQTRLAGQPVEFIEEGGPADATGSAETTVYRVVQEALTNALKYAHGRRTVVRVVHSAREIRVRVSTEQPGPHAASPGGSGRGLAGLRERVTVIGGECGDGRSAVARAAALRPDVVVMDVRMPVLDEIEATRLLAGARLVGRYASRIRPAEGTSSDDALTPRELEVLRLIANGLSNSEIATSLVISPETVKTYVSRILTKLDLRDRVQAVVYAYRHGLMT